jgi:hypothetical protein
MIFWAWTSKAFLKQLASVVKVALTFVFDLLLSAGVFWKESFVVSLCPVTVEY